MIIRITLCFFVFSTSCCTIKKITSPCDEYRRVKIKVVGGCDKGGYCGVLLENNIQLTEIYMPVVGGIIDQYWSGCRVIKP